MVIPFMVVYLTQKLKVPLDQAGLAMSVFGVGAVIGAYTGGKLTDVLGFRKIQIISLPMGGLFMILLSFMNTLESFTICVFFTAIFSEAFRPANSASIAYYSHKESLTRSYSLNRLAVNLGFGFGPALGGLLAGIDYHFLFWVDGVTCILAVLLLWRFLPPPPPDYLPTLRKQKKSGQKTTNSLIKDKAYIYFLICTAVYAFCFFHSFTLWPAYLKNDLHIDEWQIGVLLATNGLLVAVFEMFIVYKLEGRRKGMTYIVWGTLLMSVGYILHDIFPNTIPLLFVVVICITLSEIFAMPFMNEFWTSRSNDSNRGMYVAWFSVVFSMAHILTPSIGSRFAETFGFLNLWAFLSVLSILAAMGYYLIARKL